MKTIESKLEIDRSRWPSGPWDSEPDKRQWLDESSGLPCLIVRNNLGALCGYVGVRKTHPAYGAGYDDVSVSVHGGLTYADKCCGRICHVVDQGEDDDVWWLGFDCIHWDDVAPAMLLFQYTRQKTYRDFAYVTGQCESLARQLSATAH